MIKIYAIVAVIVAVVIGGLIWQLRHTEGELADAQEAIGHYRLEAQVALREASASAQRLVEFQDSQKRQLEEIAQQQRELSEQRNQFAEAERRANAAIRPGNDPVCGPVCDAFADSLREQQAPGPAGDNAGRAGPDRQAPPGVPGQAAPARPQQPRVPMDGVPAAGARSPR